MPRSWVGMVLAVVLAGAALTACAAPAVPLGETVQVGQGELRGRADGDVLRFRDVPFAAPPVGALRWRPPEPAPAWDGVRDAAGPGSRCPQRAAAPGAPHATAASADEDCLTLDVTVPAGTPVDARLPVLVWLHGGGFSAGAGADYDPRRLALAGPLVVVTPNYRLGALGFLALPGLDGSGAFGLLDQQAALRWVAANVAAFGGDPGAVTLAGESAGADGVCAQLASPGAAGLVHRAVLQSGGCTAANLVDVIRPGAGAAGDTWKPLPVAEAMGTAAVDALGCRVADRRGRPDPGLAECLRALPVDALVATTAYWSPAVGTPTLPARPSEVLASVPGVPVLAGTTRDEGTLFTNTFVGPGLAPAQLRTMLAAVGGGRDVGRAYAPTERSPSRVWADVVTDRGYACPALATYRALAARGPLYAYEFADRSAPSPFAALPGDLADGVAHGAEVPALLDLVPGPRGDDPAGLVAVWARFATTGDPGWPAWGDGTLTSVTAVGTAPSDAAAFAAEHHCELWP